MTATPELITLIQRDRARAADRSRLVRIAECAPVAVLRPQPASSSDWHERCASRPTAVEDAALTPESASAAIHETVRDHYAAAAIRVTEAAGCCTAEDRADATGAALYSILERDELPDAAVLASLGCGNPTAVADLQEGERVLDLGSGGGIDVLLSARRVGPTGRAFGLDMTDEMLALARRNAAGAGATNAEFLKGHIESIPLPAESIDVVISNCVINLAADKQAVFVEIARVLRPGGRVGVTDIVAEDRLSTEERGERGSYCGCIAGALSISEFASGLEAAGLVDVVVRPTHAVADGMISAIVQATKPHLADERATGARTAVPIQILQTSSGRGCATSGCC
jgi:arsenite methyltransferase